MSPRKEALWSNDLARNLVDIAVRVGRPEGKSLTANEVEAIEIEAGRAQREETAETDADNTFYQWTSAE